MKKLLSFLLATSLAITPMTAFASSTDPQVQSIQRTTMFGDLYLRRTTNRDSAKTFDLELPVITGSGGTTWKVDFDSPSLRLVSNTTSGSKEIYTFQALKPGTVTINASHEALWGLDLDFDVQVNALDYGDIVYDKTNNFDVGDKFTVKMLRYNDRDTWYYPPNGNPDNVVCTADYTSGSYRIFTFQVVKPGDCTITFKFGSTSVQNLGFRLSIAGAAQRDYGDVKYGQVNYFEEGSTFKIKMLNTSRINWGVESISDRRAIDFTDASESGDYTVFTFRAQREGQCRISFVTTTNPRQTVYFDINVTARRQTDFGDCHPDRTNYFEEGRSFTINVYGGDDIYWDYDRNYSNPLKLSRSYSSNGYGYFTLEALRPGRTTIRIMAGSKTFVFTVVINEKVVVIDDYGDCTPDKTTYFDEDDTFTIKMPRKSYQAWNLNKLPNNCVSYTSVRRSGDFDVYTFKARYGGSVTISFVMDSYPYKVIKFPVYVNGYEEPEDEDYGDCTLNTTNYFYLGNTFAIIAPRINGKNWVVSKVSNSNVSYTKRTTSKGSDVFTFKASKVGSTTITLRSSHSSKKTLVFKITVRNLSQVALKNKSTIAVNQIGYYSLSVNPKSGYYWTVSRSDGKVLSYYKKTTTGSGSNQKDNFYFKGLKKGNCTITFRYYQRRGNTSRLIKSNTIRVTVK